MASPPSSSSPPATMPTLNDKMTILDKLSFTYQVPIFRLSTPPSLSHYSVLLPY
jgi:hypothetical protein